jgi:hypothetical protein
MVETRQRPGPELRSSVLSKDGNQAGPLALMKIKAPRLACAFRK